MKLSAKDSEIAVTLLTGGDDKPYVFGLTMALLRKAIAIDMVGSDDLDCPEFRREPEVKFLNLRGNQRPEASLKTKVLRISSYYARLIYYAATAKPRIFHILWNNKFEVFDRTFLTAYYKLLGKKVVLTAHNVNAGRRDRKDTMLNRLSLRIQYKLADHIFVHTEKMKAELKQEFGVSGSRITIIPLGVNNSVLHTSLTSSEAKQRLGIGPDEKTILFFGRIAPYKGLEDLIAAFHQVLSWRNDCRLVIAGNPEKECAARWDETAELIQDDMQAGRVTLRANFIPDDETEIYFKAADALVLPYRSIYQSGVLLLGYSFGLPVLVSDVGSLKDDVVVGKTGFVFRPEDPTDLAKAIERYFTSDLFANLSARRQEIREFAAQRFSWDVVGHLTVRTYADLLRIQTLGELPTGRQSRASLGRSGCRNSQS